ncbi:MAG: transposase [Geobacteraceae bacterium]
MARKSRINFPGAVYHVILRGNAGGPIFFDDRDRYRLYLILQQTVERFRYRIHGFCLMTNHVHFIMQVGDIPLSSIMQNLSLRYTKWINFSQGLTGHVFQGRYKALLLDADSYLLEIVRYVHLNPVRAGMVGAPEDYPWSGHRAYLGVEIIPWLNSDWLLSMFSDKIDIARIKYRSFVADGMAEKRRNEFHRGTSEGRILGDDTFVDEALCKANQVRRQTFSLNDVVMAVCRRYGISERQLKAHGKIRPYTEARALLALLVKEHAHLSLTELGRLLGRDISPLSRSAQRLVVNAETEPRLAKLIRDLRNELLN